MSGVSSPGGKGQAAGGDSIVAQFQPLIGQLGLTPLQEEFLRGRWLDQVGWAENKSASAQKWYRRLRLSGPYADAADHVSAYPKFSANVEAIIQHDVGVFFTTVSAEKTQPQDPGTDGRGGDHSASKR